MSWLKVVLEAGEDSVERLIETLEECGAVAVTLEDAGSHTRFEAEFNSTSLWPSNRITGLFPDSVDSHAIVRHIEKRMGASLACQPEVLPDRDWQTAWQERFKPTRFGSSLWVCPSWCTPPQADATNVFIDPGLAFGSGNHPSTQLCLEWLAHYPFEGEDVIDYGCGSGILAIAALKLGANRAWGADNDPRARDVSQKNAAQNGVAERYEALPPEALPASLAAHIVLANILERSLIELAPRLTSLLRPGGSLVLAGMLEKQVATVSRCYARKLNLETHLQHEGAPGYRWAMLVGTRVRPTE